MLRKAGVKRALVLELGRRRAAAPGPTPRPNLIIPELRPYRSRADTGTWFRDETVIPYLEDRLKEIQICRDRRVPPFTARAPISRYLAAWSSSRSNTACSSTRTRTPTQSSACSGSGPRRGFLWAHSGFERPEGVRAMLRKHKSLWADLAFRTDQRRAARVRSGMASRVPGISRPLSARHRYLRPGALALYPRARRVGARLARRPAGRRGRAHRLEGTARTCSRPRSNARLARRPCSSPLPRRRASFRAATRRRYRRPAIWCSTAPSPLRSRSPSISVLEFAVCPTPQSVRVDAWMPEHRHGMNYRPTRDRDRRRPLQGRRA